MQAFGAQLEIVPSDGGRITPDLIPRLIARVAELKQQPGYYASDQFRNRDSLKGYAGIGRELLAQVDGPIHAFCGGVGTAGMLMGTAGVLRAASPATRIVALEPATSAVISTGQAGAPRIEGVGTGFVPPLLDAALYDEARGIDEAAARAMARRLARAEDVFSGISTGMNVVGALQVAQELGPGYTVVTVACDSGLKYLAGDLYND